MAHLSSARGRPEAEGKDHGGGGSSGVDLFQSDGRAGVPGTLHRISAIRDRQGCIVGLTYRVGRHVPGGLMGQAGGAGGWG